MRSARILIVEDDEDSRRPRRPRCRDRQGVPLGETDACVSTLKDGRVVRQRDFLDHAEALEAVGLRE
jgi:ketosteroid isomerase-like protein